MIKDIKKIRWIYLGIFLFIALNSVGIFFEFYFLCALPIIALIAISAFLWLDKLLLALAFMVPLSIPLSELVKGLDIDMSLPTEPILAGILLIFILKILYEKKFDKRILYHPVSIVIYIYLAWMLITTLNSSMPLVSFKFFISKVWFIVVFYFLGTQLFRDAENGKKFTMNYAIALGIVVVYALFRHATHGIFNAKIAYWSANPFYKDHTSYGAILALYLPPTIGLALYKGNTLPKKIALLTLTIILTLGLIFSYSRAAWLSLFAAAIFFIIIKLKIKLRTILAGTIIVGLLIFIFSSSLIRSIYSNTTNSSTNLTEHVKSISNISSDDSNLERLNRWSCAIRMFKEKPLFGWGPGTYMFQYGPFQISTEKTMISTREGDMGNAHSEYLGPLSEQGLFGTLNFLLIIISTVLTGFRAFKNTNNDFLKMLGLSVLLGLSTYYLHAFLNNFLDTDKLSAPFWGFMALLVAIDVYHKKETEPTNKE